MVLPAHGQTFQSANKTAWMRAESRERRLLLDSFAFACRLNESSALPRVASSRKTSVSIVLEYFYSLLARL